jgi:hypothetical protein
MFQIEKPTQVTCLKANPRTELHGNEKVRAIDLAFCLTGENNLLNQIQQGLREHHYFNKAAEEGQQSLPGELIPLPNLRFPRLPLSYHFAQGEKWRGYRFIWDWGTDERHVDFTDVALSGLHYDLLEGGSCKVYFTVQYNGEELEDNELYGELSGMASMGDVHIQLTAPAELIPAKKGYRAGKPDTPQQPAGDDGKSGDLLSPGGGGEDGDQQQGGSNPASPLDAMKKAHGVTADAE